MVKQFTNFYSLHKANFAVFLLNFNQKETEFHAFHFKHFLGEMFRVDPQSGILYARKQLDFEQEKEYSLTVQASDQGYPYHSSTLDIHVFVQDVNDNPPVFLPIVQDAFVSESAPVNTLVVQVKATDADTGNNAQLKYHLDPDSAHFGIFPNNGWVYVKKVLDREEQDAHRLSLVAVDRGIPQLMGRMALTVRILDDNDNSPVFDREVHV